MTIKRWFYNLNINTIIFLTLILTLLFSILISGYFLFHFQKESSFKSLHNDHYKITSELAKSFKLPLKNYSKAVVQSIVSVAALDERIVEISVSDLEKSEVFAHAIFPDRIKSEIYTQTMPIVLDGERYGQVSTKISAAPMHSQIVIFFKVTTILLLLQFGLSLGFLFYVLHIKLTRPIARLLSFIHTLSDYHIAPQSAWYYQDEIGRIGKAFEQAKQTITHTIMSDPQTGIHNHYMLTKILQNLFYQPSQRNFSILLMNITNFNQINDQYGHLKGDALLLALTQDIIQLKKPETHLGRWSGSSLMLICPNEKCSDIESFALQLANHVERTLYEDKIIVQCAIGIAQTQTSDSSINFVVRRANAALDTAKKRPFGTVCIQTDDGFT